MSVLPNEKKDFLLYDSYGGTGKHFGFEMSAADSSANIRLHNQHTVISFYRNGFLLKKVRKKSVNHVL